MTTTNLQSNSNLVGLARIGGLPVGTLQQLRDDDATRWAESVLDMEQKVVQRAEEFSDAVYELIGDNSDQDQRRMLITLRRKVFNGSQPSDPDGTIGLLRDIDPSVATLFEDWVGTKADLTELVGSGPTVVGEDLAGSRGWLRKVSDEPAMRRGLQIASPALARELPRYRQSDPAKAVNKKQRKFERSLVGYLTRAAIKPSPFSSFTPVQAVRTTPDGDTLDHIALSGHGRPHLRLNVAVLARLTRHLFDNDAMRDDLPVQATAGWRHDADRIRYVRRWLSQGDAGQAVTFDSVTDKVFFVRTTDTINELLDELAGEPRPFGVVAAWIADRYDASQTTSARYLRTLVQIGLVEIPVTQIPVHAADPVRALAQGLRELDAPWAVGLGDRLMGVAGTIGRVGAEATRAEAISALRGELTEIFEELGVPSRLPQTIVYEDEILGDEPVSVDHDGWHSDIESVLQVLDPVIPVFDISLVQRLTFTAFFVARFGAGGRCDDVLQLMHEFREDFFDQYQTIAGRRVAYEDSVYQPEVNWLHSESVSAIDDARVEFDQAVSRLYTGHEREAEIRIGADVLETIAKHTSRIGERPRSRNFLVQQATVGAQPCLMLNQLYGGLHFPFSRFAYALRDTDGGDFSATLRGRADGGADAVFAEMTGGPVTSNLNLHPELTDYEIVCPGDRSDRAPSQQIDFEDLYAEHDPQQDRVVLRSERLHKEVVPTYLGYLIPLALPEIPQSLLLFAPSSVARIDPWAGQSDAPETDGVSYRPRFRIGDVVVSRRTWSVAASELPTATDDVERLLVWRRWRRQHQMPERVFATVSATSDSGSKPKPMYVDFGSGLCLQALDGLLDPAATVTFTECLPEPSDAPGQIDSDRHAVEFAVETFPERGENDD